jgi:hypothetical protein
MTMRKWFVAIGAPALIVLACYLGLRQDKIEEPAMAAPRPSDTAASDHREALPIARPMDPTTSTTVDPEIIEHLRSKYGANIGNRHVQVKLIEALMRQYQKQDPEHWREKLLEAVRAAFPDRYDEIAKNLDRRIEYERWMKDNRARLEELEPDERRAAIREEREKLFGKEAADEIWASEQKNQAVSDTLKEVDGLQGKGIRDKLATYTERLEEIYEEKYDTYLEQHRHEAMNRFLGLNSVQADLDGMSAQERAENLRMIRKGMGLDEAALKRWDALDQERDARWAKGKKYMTERGALVESFSGKELEEKLAELRRRTFGDEAEVIAAEEESGLFRFNRPRKWGQN